MFPDLNPNISEQHHLIGSILRDEINDYVQPRFDLDLHAMRPNSAPPGREQMIMDQRIFQNVQMDNDYMVNKGAPSPRSNAPNQMIPPQMGWDNSMMNPLNRSGEIGIYPRQRVRMNNIDPNDYMEQFNGYDDMGDIQGYGNWPEGQRGMVPPGNWPPSRNGFDNEYIDLENNQNQETYEQYGHNTGMMNGGVNPMLFPELVQGMGNLTIQPRPMIRNPRLTRSTSGNLDGFIVQQQRQNNGFNPNSVPPGQRLFMSGEYGYGGMRNDMGYGMQMNSYGRPHMMQDYGYQEENNNTYQRPGMFPREPMSPKSRTSTNPGKLSKSSLLEEFRNSKSNKFDLIDIIGNFVEFSGDQYGSRFIQQKLETAPVSDKEMVFNEIYPQCISLMTDVFGNYVIQKFFEHGTAEQKRALGSALVGNVLTLSLQMYGCRVVQKALEAIDQEQQAQLVKELEGHVLICIKDQNGNHVIQKIIERVPVSCTQFIVDTFVNQVYQLATHPYGCRVIQRILEHHGIFNTEPPIQIVRELLHCAISLVQDQYGNYVIQHVLKHGRPEDKHEIIKQLRGKIVQYSQHKFASNVIEQCVEHGNDEQRKWIIDEILQEPTALANMMKHQYANYVIQKILEVSEDDQRLRVIELIRPHISSLKKYTYGKHIINRLERINGKFNS